MHLHLHLHLHLTRAEAIEHEIRKPLAEGLEDLLPEPLPGSRTYPAVDDYYDVRAIADEVLELFVTGGGRGAYHCLNPDIYPALLWDITEEYALPADA